MKNSSTLPKSMAILISIMLVLNLLPSCSQVKNSQECRDSFDPNESFVDVSKIIPGIQIDMRYATDQNFMGECMYPSNKCLLRKSVAERLHLVQKDLEEQGLGLKILDAYRPLSVQKRMWEVMPDPEFVANPRTGSSHNRGAAVDVTLVDAQGNELPMPSAFDEFTDRARLSYQGGSSEALKNRRILQEAMIARGFLPLQSEWWHFYAPRWKEYPIADVPLE